MTTIPAAGQASSRPVIPSSCRALCVAALVAVAATSVPGPAAAQVMLYENRLPDGFAYVRFVNTMPDAVTIKPDGFADTLSLGTDGAARISAYYTVEKVAGRDLAIDLKSGSASDHATFALKPGSFHTILIGRDGAKAGTKVVVDQSEINQTRARLAFYNAVPDCAGAALQLDPSGSSVFSGVAPESMRGRSVNPSASARVRAGCGAKKVDSLALGELSAGGQYSIWYMAPGGTPVAFMSENSIAPYLR